MGQQLPQKFEELRGFVKRHPDSTYSIYYRRAYVELHRVYRNKVEAAHVWDAEARHWLTVNAPWVDFDPVEGHHFIRFSFARGKAGT